MLVMRSQFDVIQAAYLIQHEAVQRRGEDDEDKFKQIFREIEVGNPQPHITDPTRGHDLLVPEFLPYW